VKGFAIGDHVSVIFDLNNLTGHEDGPSSALGGDAAGVLREYAIYEDKHLVQLPKSLSWEEVSHIHLSTVLRGPISLLTSCYKPTGSYYHLCWRHCLDRS
jgi:NADPH:quinone reductase-like Zn-dependent oxidoreductase